jgi:N-acetylglucosaminyldiphosphoundecaprenol N-acetyl-beta-D-mannosaminyltransferase
MFGVGAAFDFHTGRIKDCADWIKRCGLQWLDRLVQDPKHLWKRYLKNNPRFVVAIVWQLTGLRSYAQAGPEDRQPGGGQAALGPPLPEPGIFRETSV